MSVMSVLINCILAAAKVDYSPAALCEFSLIICLEEFNEQSLQHAGKNFSNYDSQWLTPNVDSESFGYLETPGDLDGSPSNAQSDYQVTTK